MTAILGISGFYHDSAAALVVDGRIVAAAQEERFSRVKHDAAFPQAASAYCLDAAGLSGLDLDYVVFYEKPFWKFERLLESHLAFAPRGYQAFRRAMPSWFSYKLPMTREIRRQLALPRRVPIVYLDHHQSHAASAFLPSPYDEAAILTVDGVGEWSTTCIGLGRGNQLELIEELRFPHSLGLLFSAFTAYLGFRVNGGEYKVMGLAPYGEPKYADCILNRLLDLKADGSFRLDMRYFDFAHAMRMTSRRFDQLLGGPPRVPESALETRHLDIAASLQQVTNEIMLRLARHAHARTGARHLVLAGGVALNCVANSHILQSGPFEELWIQPAAGDAGGALGAALFVWHSLLQHPRTPVCDAMHGALLGPSFSEIQIRSTLDSQGAQYHHYTDRDQLLRATSELLDEQNVIGWFQGRMEFGPRALGARSILADPRSSTMTERLNAKVKRRESFRPFAPSVLADHASKIFDWPKSQANAYMLLTANVAANQRVPVHEQASAAVKGLGMQGVVRSRLPAITHIDYSARVQSVDALTQPQFHSLLECWYHYSGCPVLINTSFNVRGEPLVCSPEDAWHCFMSTEMDALIIGDFLLLKCEQSAKPMASGRQWPAD